MDCKPDEADGDLGLLMRMAESGMRSLVLHPASRAASKFAHDGAVRCKTDMHGRVDTFVFSCDSCGHSDVTEMTHRLGAALAARSASLPAASGTAALPASKVHHLHACVQVRGDAASCWLL